jgi:hypothetical protein
VVTRMDRPTSSGLLFVKHDAPVGGPRTHDAPLTNIACSRRSKMAKGGEGIDRAGDQRSKARSMMTSMFVTPPHVDALPHLYVLIDRAGDEVDVGLVDKHGVDRSVMRQKGVDTSAFGELPCLDGLVVGGRVQQTPQRGARQDTMTCCSK